MKKITLKLLLVSTIAIFVSCGGKSSKAPKTIVIDGYEAIKIGNQTWMTKNLNIDKFRNGEPIPEAKNSRDWNEAGQNKKPVFCYFNYVQGNGGKLYNIYAVIDPRGFSPKNWHVPTDAEWTQLTDYLGGPMQTIKMKSESGWDTNEGTNESGFSALPGGYCDYTGSFDQRLDKIGKIGVWWSSTLYGTGEYHWSRNIGVSSCIQSETKPNEEGYSIRCIKD